MRVFRRPVAGDARPVGCAFVLLAFSVVFAVAAVPSLPAAGAVLYLLVGAAGIALCTAGLAATTGRLLARRPVLELDDRGVRLPAPWPWSRTRDRVLEWPDLASAVVWHGSSPRGRHPVTGLAFLPTATAAERTLPLPSAELLALRLEDLPGVASAHWATRVQPGWDTGAEQILDEVRRHGLPVVDARSR